MSRSPMLDRSIAEQHAWMWSLFPRQQRRQRNGDRAVTSPWQHEERQSSRVSLVQNKAELPCDKVPAEVVFRSCFEVQMIHSFDSVSEVSMAEDDELSEFSQRSTEPKGDDDHNNSTVGTHDSTWGMITWCLVDEQQQQHDDGKQRCWTWSGPDTPMTLSTRASMDGDLMAETPWLE